MTTQNPKQAQAAWAAAFLAEDFSEEPPAPLSPGALSAAPADTDDFDVTVEIEPEEAD